MGDDKRFRPLKPSDSEYHAAEDWLRENDPDYKPTVDHPYEERSALPYDDARMGAYEYELDDDGRLVEVRPPLRDIENVSKRTRDWQHDKLPHRKKDRHKNRDAEWWRDYRAAKKEEQLNGNDRPLDGGQERTYAPSDNGNSPGTADTARGATTRREP